MLLWTCVYNCLCRPVFISLGSILTSGIAGSNDNTGFNIEGTAKPLPKVTALVHIPTSSVFQPLRVLVGSCHCVLSTSAIPVKWCFPGVWCVSLMTHDVQHLFMCQLAICMSSLENTFRFLAHFQLGYLSWQVVNLCMFWLQVSYQIRDLQVCPHVLWVTFLCSLKPPYFSFWWSLIYLFSFVTCAFAGHTE